EMPEFEKVEYKPKPVREILLEMKNLSELMIDLAYSAALFNDKELAEEVLELEKKVDTLAYLLDMTIMIAARNAEDAEALAGVAKVAGATDKISDAAADIAAIVKQDIGVHPIVTHIFEKVEEHIARARVDEKSVMVGKKIGKLNIAAKIGTDIIAIRRGGDWIVKPNDEEKILAGDILIARGNPLGISKFKDIAEGKVRRIVGVKEDAAEK
ncbi:MAG: TrkA C-terminal domain-containing protein, partial [Thermoproteota archaeon]